MPKFELRQIWHEFAEESSKIIHLREPILSTLFLAILAYVLCVLNPRDLWPLRGVRPRPGFWIYRRPTWLPRRRYYAWATEGENLYFAVTCKLMINESRWRKVRWAFPGTCVQSPDHRGAGSGQGRGVPTQNL